MNELNIYAIATLSIGIPIVLGCLFLAIDMYRNGGIPKIPKPAPWLKPGYKHKTNGRVPRMKYPPPPPDRTIKEGQAVPIPPKK